MNERPAPSSRGPDRVRWFMVAVLILLGIALYFWFAASSRVAAPPVVETE
jgi:4-hydroxybenzoate polyprenyltransferase